MSDYKVGDVIIYKHELCGRDLQGTVVSYSKGDPEQISVKGYPIVFVLIPEYLLPMWVRKDECVNLTR